MPLSRKKLIIIGIAIITIIVLVIIATLAYLGKLPSFSQQQAQEPQKPDLSSVFYLTAGNQLTEAEQTHLLSDKTAYSSYVFEYSTMLSSEVITTLKQRAPVYLLVTSVEELQSEIAPTVAHFFVPEALAETCKTLEYTCFVYSTNTESMELLPSSPVAYEKSVQFFDETSRHTLYMFACVQDETCLESFLATPPSVVQNTMGKTSFMLLRNDKQQLTPFVTRLPQLEIDIKAEKAPAILWKINDPSGMFIQQAYSSEVLYASTQESVVKSGKVWTQVTGGYFVPTSEPKENNFLYKLNVWYGLDLESPAIATTLTATKQFSHQFALPDFSGDISGNTQYIAWIPDWGMARALTSLRANPKRWNTISPVWYFLNKDGTFTVERNVNHPELLSIARNNNITVIPTITQFDPDILSEALNNHFDEHIKNIVDLVNKNNYVGIDLDYESTYLADKELFEKFIETLSVELKKTNKILVFTVLPKWSDEKIYTFLPQTRQVQDWAFLAKHVDEIRIMGYDFTSQGSIIPGPLSPIIWNEAILDYALQKVPAEKLVLALPIYSHGWPEPSSSDPAGPNNDQEISVAQKNTISLQHDDIAEIKRTIRGYNENFDTWNSEVRSTFRDGSINRVMFHLDKRAVQEREKLAKKYKIKGLAFWRMGGEDL